VRKTKPAIYSGPKGWGWVELQELAKIIQLSPWQVFERFWNLSKDSTTETPCLPWVDSKGQFHQGYGGTKSDYPEWHSWIAENIFVPAGWSQDVLKAVELGAARVEVVGHIHCDNPTENDEDECPLGTIECRYLPNTQRYVAIRGVDRARKPIAIFGDRRQY
jgi:hypothetical protein